ncbi:MAG: phage major capsid protein [Pseudomonadota bacterium]
MTQLVSRVDLQEALSLAVAARSPGYTDLVSNSNGILFLIKEKGGWKSYSGPEIRERLLWQESGTYTRYSGLQYLNPIRKEMFSDAVYDPKQSAVSIVLAGDDLLDNSGEAAILDIMTEKLSAGEQELTDRFVEDLHSDGTETNQVGGLQQALPTTVNSGVYGGIDRSAYTIWQTSTYDIDTDFTGISQFTSSTAQEIIRTIVIQRSRNKRGPGCVAACEQHFSAYSASLEAIQRIQNENGLGKLGFTNLEFAGAGKTVPIMLEGGIGTAMPDDVSYFLDFDGIRFRYHPDREFTEFGGMQTPVNQDAVVQHIGMYGNLTMFNPLHQAKLYDSDTAS